MKFLFMHLGWNSLINVFVLGGIVFQSRPTEHFDFRTFDVSLVIRSSTITPQEKPKMDAPEIRQFVAMVVRATPPILPIQSDQKRLERETVPTNQIPTDPVPRDPVHTEQMLAAQGPTEPEFKVEGEINLSKGLIYSPNTHIISVYRSMGDGALEEGTIDPNSGLFSLGAKELEGHIVAELKTKSGELLGRGYASAADLGLRRRVVIEPVSLGVSGRTIAANAFDNYVVGEAEARVEIPNVASNIKVDELGYFREVGMNSESSFILEARKKDYLTTTAFGRAGRDISLMLFPNDLLEGFSHLLSRRLDRKKGVIWGRVASNKGLPIEGASVELSEVQTEPVYFSSALGNLMPDLKKDKTSTNGQFAFFDVPVGIHFVRALVNGFPISQILSVEEGGVFTVELKTEEKPPLPVMGQVVDLINNRGRPSRLSLAEANEVWQTNQEGIFSWTPTSLQGFSLIEADPGNGYEVSRMFLSRDTKEFVLPAIPSNWFKRLSGEAEGSGDVIGFVDGDNYEVFVAPDKDEAQIIYFDQRGETLNHPVGIKGGGFIVRNLEPGFTNLKIVPDRGGQPHYRLVWIDPKSISTVLVTF